MLKKEKLTTIMLSHNKILNKNNQNHSNICINNFQREKGSLVREIMNFHLNKFSQAPERGEEKKQATKHLEEYFICSSRPAQTQKISSQKFKSDSPIRMHQYFNNYQASHQSNKNVVPDEEQYNVIDLFIKEKCSQNDKIAIDQPTTTANILKCQNKSFNQSTMALSKLQKSSLSPYRKIRKTENCNQPQLSSISENHYSESLFNLTENQSSLCTEGKHNEPIEKQSPKKVAIDLGQRARETIKLNKKAEIKLDHRFNPNLEEVQEYEELFDCSSERKEDEEAERDGIFNYLKNKITMLKLDKSQRRNGDKSLKQESNAAKSSNGESVGSFQSLIERQKEQLNENGCNKVNRLIDEAIKTVNEHIQLHEEAKKPNHEDVSSLFFPSMMSQPSTVQKIDQRSNDKSELLRHLEDLADYSIATDLFKKIEPIQDHLESSSHKHKQIVIDLQDIHHSQSSKQSQLNSNDPSMPSFKIEPSSINKERSTQKAHHQILSKEGLSVNFDDLSNYESDDSVLYKLHQQQLHPLQTKTSQQKTCKAKSKIILKSISLNINKETAQLNSSNIVEKQIIEELKHDISQLKNKIETSFISQKMQTSFIKQKTQKNPVKIVIDLSKASDSSQKGEEWMHNHSKQSENNEMMASGLSELKLYVKNLQNRMLKDAGMPIMI